MTFVDEVEVRHASVGTKVLAFACGIFVVLGSFWAIVWFIRAYVEAPRVNIPAPMVLAAGESRPAPAPESRVIPQAEAAPAALVVQVEAKSTTPPVAAPAAKNPPAAPRAAEPSAAGAVADRWFPMNQLGAPAPATPAPAPPAPIIQAEPPAPPAAAEPAAANAADAADSEPPIEEVVGGSVPAIAGRAPLPRRKPTMTASRRVETPPLPRPRPDGPAPQSVWTGVPATDERFVGQ
jgi:hypothetical protein